MKFKYLALSLLYCIILNVGYSQQQLVSVAFQGSGTCPSQVQKTNNQNLSFSLRRVGVKCVPINEGFGSKGWSSSLDTSKYIELKLSAFPRKKIDISTITLHLGKNSSGPESCIIQYLQNDSTVGSSHQSIGTNQSQVTLSPNSLSSDFSGIITIRIFCTNVTDPSGAFVLGKAVINGSIQEFTGN
jgi:hypothetical protein